MSMLFQGMLVGGMSLADGFVRSATCESRAADDGRCTPELLNFTGEVARGGVRLVITGHGHVEKNGEAGRGKRRIYSDDLVPDLMQAPQKVHE